MSCEHDCDRPPVFPSEIHNRPGLLHFGYRIGTYAEMRAHMLDRLAKEPALSGWTHFGPDEPGIALLEGTAIIGDILTFYQQLYGNETKLGTADWPESVADLIRITGYRPAPGLGGAALFALEIDGTDPVVVPAGFPFEAQLETQDAPSLFESTAAIEAYPAFNAFHLYRPRLGLQPIGRGAASFDIVRLGTAADLATRAEADLNEGDRVMILSGPFDPQEILVVSSVEEHLDRVTIHFDGAVQESHPAEVTAYKIGRTFRHFGADAPREFTTFRESPPEVHLHDAEFERPTTTTATTNSTYYTRLAPRQMPLDQEVDDLAAGAHIICTGRAINPSARDFVLVRRIDKITPREVTWANVTAPVTMLRLNAGLIARSGPRSHDIRRLRVYETLGPRMILRAPPKQRAGRITDGSVNFFGTRAEAAALAGRKLLFSGLTDTPQQITVAGDQPALAALPDLPKGDRRMWPLQVSTLPEAGASGFSETDPAVTIFGNLVDATEGETVSETVLGSGDSRLSFQTFTLPKAPLTFLPDPTRAPPRQAELEIRVAGRLWSAVDTFFDQPADAEIFVIRQDEDGKDVVQFGNGVNAARLPSGRNNVTASFRIGSGAWGNLAAEAKPKAKSKLKPLIGVQMPGPATGGAAPEGMDTARVAAPGRIQSLGRLVGLSDYEAEALANSGVLKAGATFGTGLAPAIDLTILTEDESAEAVAAVETALRHADRCRGPARYPLRVSAGKRRYVAVTLRAGYDSTYRSADLDAAIAEALGALPLLDGDAPEDGLFSLNRRGFGQDAHVSQAVAAAQLVAGVVWVTPTSFRRLSTASDDPSDIPLPAAASLYPRLGATPREVLALSAHHLVLDTVTVTSDEECPQ